MKPTGKVLTELIDESGRTYYLSGAREWFSGDSHAFVRIYSFREINELEAQLVSQNVQQITA